MKCFRKSLTALVLSVSALCGKADNLYIIGDGTPYGWDLDKATALLSATEIPVYTGTIYLKAGQSFKFLTVPDWGNEEYGAVIGTTIEDGKVALAKGVLDEGYAQLSVAEDANYIITVNTESMTAEFVKSAYQESEISLCSLFLVGSPTPGGWDVMAGTPLYQNVEKPYEYAVENLTLGTGDFKIATTLKGASSWNGEYWYFRDSSDPNKVALNQDGDPKWEIAEAGQYDIVVNLLDGSIYIKPYDPNAVYAVDIDESSEAEYYTLTGIKVANPQNGMYICKLGSKSQIVIIK